MITQTEINYWCKGLFCILKDFLDGNLCIQIYCFLIEIILNDKIGRYTSATKTDMVHGHVTKPIRQFIWLNNGTNIQVMCQIAILYNVKNSLV